MNKEKEIIEKIGALAKELNTTSPDAAFMCTLVSNDGNRNACVVCGKPQGIALALASVYTNVPAVRELYQQAIDAIDYAVRQQQLISKQN